MDHGLSPAPPAIESSDERPGVVLADSSLLVLYGLRALLADQVDVVGTSDSYESLRTALDEQDPDTAVVELKLLYQAEAGAFGALQSLAARVAVVVMGDEIFPADLLRSFRAGARGVVIKDDRPEKLMEAIRVAQDCRQRYIDPRLAPDVLDATRKGERGGDRPFGLTTQELRVVRLVADEHTNPEIARRLGISVETVKTHVGRALDKLGAYDRVHLVRIAATHEEIRQIDPPVDAEHGLSRDDTQTDRQ